jgi:hypothetical protein
VENRIPSGKHGGKKPVVENRISQALVEIKIFQDVVENTTNQTNKLPLVENRKLYFTIRLQLIQQFVHLHHTKTHTKC